MGGTENLLPFGSGTEYQMLGAYEQDWTVTEAESYQIMPTSGTLKNFNFYFENAIGIGNSASFTIRKNESDTDLSILISNAETSGSDSDTVSVSAGDKITIEGTINSGYGIHIGNTYWNVEFTPTIVNETILLGGNGGKDMAVSGEYFYLVNGADTFGTADASYFEIVFPVSGTIKKFYAWLENSPGVGATRTVDVYDTSPSGGDTDLDITFGASDTTSNNTSDTVTVSAGDTFALHYGNTGSPTASMISFGCVFIPDTSGSFCTFVTNPTISIDETRYVPISGANVSSDSVELDRYTYCPALTFTDMYMTAYQASGGTFTFTLRDDGVDTALECTLVDPATVANDTGESVSVAAGSACTIESVETSAATDDFQISIGLLVHKT